MIKKATMENRISHELSAQALTEIQTGITNLKNSLNFLVNLSPDQRQSLFKMGDKSLGFVGKAVEFMERYPALCPNYVDAAEVKKDYTLAAALGGIAYELEALTQALRDTSTLAGNEAITSSISYYSSVRDASRRAVPNAETTYNALSERFPGRRMKKPDAEQ